MPRPNRRLLAQHLHVDLRTVRSWEQGRYPIPNGVRLEFERLEAQTGEFIGGCVGILLDLPDPGIVTYHSDAEYHATNPEIPFPASWHRAVCARIALEVPGLPIVYADDVAPRKRDDFPDLPDERTR